MLKIVTDDVDTKSEFYKKEMEWLLEALECISLANSDVRPFSASNQPLDGCEK